MKRLQWPNKIAVETAVGAGRSAGAVPAARKAWLGFLRLGSITHQTITTL